MRAMNSKSLFAAGLALLFPSVVHAQAKWWEIQTSGVDTNLRSVSAIFGEWASLVRIVWASGSNGVILQSLDKGKTWNRLHVTAGDTLDFRGIVAFSDKTAYLMSSGEGEKSRIYKTTDGGKTWKLQYSDKRKEFFLDSIACLSEKECFALGDPINSKFLLLKTSDGEHWNPLPTEDMPAALPGEGAFAASNSCLLLSGGAIFFGTGGPAARVFRSLDSGRTWTVTETPIAHGNASSGIFSIAHGEEKEIVVVGGDYKAPSKSTAVAAYSLDGGQTWQLPEHQPGGFRSAVACDEDGAACVAIGPNGEDVSVSKVTAAYWKPIDSLNLNAMAIFNSDVGWAVGPNGTVARYIEHVTVWKSDDRPTVQSQAPPIAASAK